MGPSSKPANLSEGELITGSRSDLRTALLSFYLPSIIHSLCGGLIFPVMPLLALSLDASYGAVGTAVAASAIGMLLTDIPSGIATRRLGPKRTMILGAALTIISSLAVLRVESVAELIGYRLIAGAGLAFWTTARHTYLIDLFRSEQRGRGSALVGGIHRLTAVIGPLVGGYVADSLGLRSPFVIYVALAFIAMMMILIYMPAGRPSGGKRPQEHQGLAAVLKSHYGSLLRAGPAYICVAVVRSARDLLVPLYGAEVVGLTASGIGVITSISYAADLLMVYPAGVIMDRFGRKYASVPSFFIQSVALALLPLIDSFGSLLAVAAFMGFGNGLGSGAMITLGADLAPRHAPSEFLGLWRFVGDAGSATGPKVAGEMAEVAGLDASAFLIAGAGLGATALLWFAVPETLKKNRKAEDGGPPE